MEILLPLPLTLALALTLPYEIALVVARVAPRIKRRIADLFIFLILNFSKACRLIYVSK